MGVDKNKRQPRGRVWKWAISSLKVVFGLLAGGLLIALIRRLCTGGGRARRINSYVVNGTKALELSKLARRLVPRGGVERVALLGAQMEYNPRVNTSLSSQSIGPKRPLLCSTFTVASEDSLDLLYANMRQLGGLCDWAVVFYKPPADSVVRAFRANLTETLGAVRVVLFDAAVDRLLLVQRFYHSPHSLDIGGASSSFLRHRKKSERLDNPRSWPFNSAAYPKPLLFLHLLPLLGQYQRVWLLDDDISLESFELSKFLAISNCAFWPAAPPLVVQPMLHPTSKLYPFLSEKDWREEERRHGSKFLAVGTGFIEVQAPLLDSSFFSWFLRFLVVPMVAPLHVVGADWGFDDLFCTAAANFQYYSGRQGQQHRGEGPPGPSCAVVVGGSTMRHLDRGVLKAAIGKGTKWYLNHEMLAIVRETFPTMFHKGFLSLLASPINSTGRSLHQRAVEPLATDCLLRY